MFTDFDHNWVAKFRFKETLNVSLCALERRNRKTPCIYFPKIEKNNSGEVFWNLDMKHLARKRREVTLMFSFEGKLEAQQENIPTDVSSELRNLIENYPALIRNINQRPYYLYPRHSGKGSSHFHFNFLGLNVWRSTYFSDFCVT